jgi:hypothetical protein
VLQADRRTRVHKHSNTAQKATPINTPSGLPDSFHPSCNSGKTSLLFNYAFHIASQGQTVLFLCDQRALDQSSPFLPHAVDANHPALSNIHFK